MLLSANLVQRRTPGCVNDVLFLLFQSQNKTAGSMLFACWGGALGAALNTVPTTSFFQSVETSRVDNVDSNTAYYIPVMGQGLHKLLVSSTLCFL